jgi:transposase
MVARRVFPQEFREEAVRRAEEPGVRVAELATELDVNISVLRRWIKEKKAGRWDKNYVPYAKRPKTKGVPTIATDEPPEKPPKVSSSNQELQQHLATITQERDMLKQMLAFYLNKQ